VTRLWRISNYVDLSGTGGLLAPGRWHSEGRRIVYASANSAGAMTEHLAHLDRADIPDTFQLIEIEIADGVVMSDLGAGALPFTWTSDENVTRALGDAWLASGTSLALRVPSALVPDAWNVLLNPAHPDASRMKVNRAQKVPLDPRLRPVNKK
jgi:RES domain-containing protein